MLKYDPERAPDPQAWLDADEHERMEAVRKWHKKARVEVPNLSLHASLHLIIENQLAENIDSVVRALSRVMQEGLSRHDAIHAVASVLSVHIFNLMNSESPDDPAVKNASYYAELDRLTAKSWLSMADD